MLFGDMPHPARHDIFAATWDNIGLAGPISTPKIFAEMADDVFRAKFKSFVINQAYNKS